MSPPPVRCFTCGRVLADKWEAFKRMTAEEEAARPKQQRAEAAAAAAAGPAPPDGVLKTPQGAALDRLGLTGQCCRTVMLTHVDMSLQI